MAENDIRSLTDVDNDTGTDMGPQRLGKITFKQGRKQFGHKSGASTRISEAGGPNAAIDPNNIVDKFDERFNDPTYY